MRDQKRGLSMSPDPRLEVQPSSRWSSPGGAGVRPRRPARSDASLVGALRRDKGRSAGNVPAESVLRGSKARGKSVNSRGGLIASARGAAYHLGCGTGRFIH